MFGVLQVLFGSPAGGAASGGMQKYFEWVEHAGIRGRDIVLDDRQLDAFIKSRQVQIKRAIADLEILVEPAGGAEQLGNALTDAVTARLRRAKGLSARARGYLRRGLPHLVETRRRTGRPLTARYVINRVTTLDWGVLDVVY